MGHSIDLDQLAEYCLHFMHVLVPVTFLISLVIAVVFGYRCIVAGRSELLTVVFSLAIVFLGPVAFDLVYCCICLNHTLAAGIGTAVVSVSLQFLFQFTIVKSKKLSCN